MVKSMATENLESPIYEKKKIIETRTEISLAVCEHSKNKMLFCYF